MSGEAPVTPTPPAKDTAPPQTPAPPPPPASEPGPAPAPEPPAPGWRARVRAWFKRALLRLAWMLALFLAGMLVSVVLWVTPTKQRYEQLTRDYQNLQSELAQTKADLGQAQGQIQTLQEAQATAETQARQALQWMAFYRARSEAWAAWAALQTRQEATARTHLTLAQRALEQLTQQATDPDLRRAAQDILDALGDLLDTADTTSASALARRVQEQVLTPLDALEDLLPPQP